MDRQNGGENWSGANETFDANASFSQNWLETDRTNEPIDDAPRVVGLLPDVSNDGASEISLKSKKTPRRAAVRTASVAIAAFSLGVVSTLCGAVCWNGSGNSSNSDSNAVAEIGARTDSALSAATSKNGDFSLAEITSSTLRSVPDEGVNDAFGDAHDPFAESLIKENVVVNRNFNGFNAQDSIATTNNDAENAGNSVSPSFLGETTSLADEIVRPGSRDNVAPFGAPRSNDWNQNDEFEQQNRPTQIADVPVNVVAERENYPTWNDLEADAARRRAIATRQTPQTSDVGGYYAANVPQNPQTPNAASEQNIADAPNATDYPQIANAPFNSSEQNIAPASETTNYPQIAQDPFPNDFPTVGDYAALNPIYSTNSADSAPQNGLNDYEYPTPSNVSNGFERSSNSVGAANPTYPENANATAPVDGATQRRLVAQVPSETANAARYPLQNSDPVAAPTTPARNLRW